MLDSIHLKIPSLPENIRMIESFIDNARDKYSLNDDIYGNIMIAVTESVNNAILHGNQKNVQKNVGITLELEEGSLIFHVKDEGPGFDFKNLPDPTAPENLDKPGGRGIFLMRNLADEVHFDDEGRQVTLRFYMN